MYSSYFGFRESPFNVTPDPSFFYTNPVYLEAFATSRYRHRGQKGLRRQSRCRGRPTGRTNLAASNWLRSSQDTVRSSLYSSNTLLVWTAFTN